MWPAPKVRGSPAQRPGGEIASRRSRSNGFQCDVRRARVLLHSQRVLGAGDGDHVVTLSLGDWEALAVLQRSGPPYERTPNEIAQAIGVTSGTISVRIDRLTQAGLIERASGRPDRRRRPVRLTRTGEEQWCAATADRTDVEQDRFADALSRSELEQLNALLAKLLLRFEDELGVAPARGPSTPTSDER